MSGNKLEPSRVANRWGWLNEFEQRLYGNDIKWMDQNGPGPGPGPELDNIVIQSTKGNSSRAEPSRVLYVLLSGGMVV